eukprot:14551613-Alexandrium_andersonii.AAC.1
MPTRSRLQPQPGQPSGQGAPPSLTRATGRDLLRKAGTSVVARPNLQGTAEALARHMQGSLSLIHI